MCEGSNDFKICVNIVLQKLWDEAAHNESELESEHAENDDDLIMKRSHTFGQAAKQRIFGKNKIHKN